MIEKNIINVPINNFERFTVISQQYVTNWDKLRKKEAVMIIVSYHPNDK